MLATTRPTMLLAVLCLVQACANTIESEIDYNPKTDFSGLKTFAWLPEDSRGGNSEEATYRFIDEKVRAAVDSNLQAKGFRPQKEGTPDFYVNYYVWAETKLTDDPYAGLRNWSHRLETLDTARYPGYEHERSLAPREYEEGTLIVTVLDPETEREIWRGTAKDLVKQSDVEKKSGEKIDKAVKEILKNFPPTK
ncbi:MAG: DUF4136 domain-containing protein [Gammaproteobacteria bacterium]|nr:DUF4136 domain-containing protein [Gammaproteobacteria bacterium]